MHIKGGQTNYRGKHTLVHPFYVQRPKLRKRDLIFLHQRSMLWRRIAMTGLVGACFNIVLMMWVLSLNTPTIFVNTVLKSGYIYQRGYLNQAPLGKKKGRTIASHSMKRHENTREHRDSDYE